MLAGTGHSLGQEAQPGLEGSSWALQCRPPSPTADKTGLGMELGAPYVDGCPSRRARHGKAQGGQAPEEPPPGVCVCVSSIPSFQSSHLSVSTHLCSLVPRASPSSL